VAVAPPEALIYRVNIKPASSKFSWKLVWCAIRV
jgi:hypothetical protein